MVCCGAVLLSYDWQNGSIPLVEDWRDWRNVATLVFYTSLAATLVYSWINRKVSLIAKTLIYCLLHLLDQQHMPHYYASISFSSPFDFFWPGQLPGRYRRRPFHNLVGRRALIVESCAIV